MIEKTFTIIQMTFCLVFGRHFITLLNPSIPYIDPPGRSHRHRSFRSRHRTDPNCEIDISRDEGGEYSRHSQQGRGDLLRGYIHVSSIDCGYVYCGKGGILHTDARV